MNRQNLFGVILLLGVLGATEGFAQKRGGRTDGPENSEWGYGGYSRSTMGAFSLAADFGANIPTKSKIGGTPLYVGGTASYWVTDWAQVDLHVNYAFNTDRLMALIGPTFRTDTWLLSFSLACRAGLAYDLKEKKGRFAVSPELGMNMLLLDHFIVGLLAAFDLPIGKGLMPSQVRVGLRLGWRF